MPSDGASLLRGIRFVVQFGDRDPKKAADDRNYIKAYGGQLVKPQSADIILVDLLSPGPPLKNRSVYLDYTTPEPVLHEKHWGLHDILRWNDQHDYKSRVVLQTAWLHQLINDRELSGAKTNWGDWRIVDKRVALPPPTASTSSDELLSVTESLSSMNVTCNVANINCNNNATSTGGSVTQRNVLPHPDPTRIGAMPSTGVKRRTTSHDPISVDHNDSEAKRRHVSPPQAPRRPGRPKKGDHRCR